MPAQPSRAAGPDRGDNVRERTWRERWSSLLYWLLQRPHWNMPCCLDDAGVAGRAAADMAVGGGSAGRGRSALVLLEVGSDVEGCGGKRGREGENPSGPAGGLVFGTYHFDGAARLPLLQPQLSAEVAMDLAKFSLPGVEPGRPLFPLWLCLCVVSSMHPAEEMVGRRLLEDWIAGWKASIHALIMSTCPKGERMRLWHVYLRLGAFTRRDGRGQIPVKCHLVRRRAALQSQQAWSSRMTRLDKTCARYYVPWLIKNATSLSPDQKGYKQNNPISNPTPTPPPSSLKSPPSPPHFSNASPQTSSQQPHELHHGDPSPPPPALSRPLPPANPHHPPVTLIQSLPSYVPKACTHSFTDRQQPLPRVDNTLNTHRAASSSIFMSNSRRDSSTNPGVGACSSVGGRTGAVSAGVATWSDVPGDVTTGCGVPAGARARSRCARQETQRSHQHWISYQPMARTEICWSMGCLCRAQEEWWPRA